MPKIPDNTQVTWETVGLPLVKGVDLRVPGRGVEAQSFIRLENARLEDTVGVRKRRGHKAFPVRMLGSRVGAAVGEGGSANSSGGAGGAVGTEGTVQGSDSWLYGIGLNPSGLNTTWSIDSGLVAGMARRDDEVLAWDGWRMLSWPGSSLPGYGMGLANQSYGRGYAYFPTARTRAIAKAPISQKYGDIAATDSLVAVVYYDSSDTYFKLSVYDAVTQAPYLDNVPVSAAAALHCRVVAVGDWIHVVSSTTTALTFKSIHQSEPSTLRTGLTVLGEVNTYFDVKRVSDEQWALVKRDLSNVARLSYLNADGSTNTSLGAGANLALDTGPADGNQFVERVALAVHPQTSEIMLAWNVFAAPGVIQSKVYLGNGSSPGTRRAVNSSLGGLKSIVAESRYTRSIANGESLFVVMYDEDDGGGTPLYTSRYNVTRTAAEIGGTRLYGRLASQPFRVGDVVFVILRHQSLNTATYTDLQRAYYIVDDSFQPVGRLEYGTAAESAEGYGLPGVNAYHGQGLRNPSRFHTAVAYRERLDSANNDQYDEESIKLVEMDFLPRLRWAQQGRTTYFAGAQLHAYDGREIVEAGFHTFPENVVAAQGAAVANTVPNGAYRYRVRWAYKNAQGEETLSAYTYSNEVTVAGGPKEVTVTFPSLQFSRRDLTKVYALVYRNEASGTQWYLVSSRDPTSASCPKNAPGSYTVTFTDSTTNTALISKEKDIGDSGELEPFSPPSNEIVVAGRDRLWLAGGEITSGEILPSKLFAFGRTVEFSPALQTTIDRGADPVTGLAFLGHSTLVFKRTKIYAMEADGPNNLGAGAFDYPRVIPSDVGAVSPDSVALAPQGVVFESPAGIRLLATNYLLMDIGKPVRPVTDEQDITATLVVPTDQEVRFYTLNGPTLVWNYRVGEWATWTGTEAAGAVLHPSSGYAIIGRVSGDIWIEDPDMVDDGGLGFEFVARTAWLYRANLMQGFQRVRRFALVGDMRGAHNLRVRVYYDDRDYPQDQWTWAVATDLNSSTWGASTWGAGLWGDVNGSATTFLKDGVYATRRRLTIQKCSRISFEISDLGAKTKGPALTEIALELGERGGLGRLPARTNTSV